ncbi:Prosaposin [Oryzias melastigma]|uniref:Prosaposin n=2 Tax=Oryzias melastigma TaxID=30732 RepID=A0A834CA63_ORYME|nr:Prosaposin [Oryzias melastigma]
MAALAFLLLVGLQSCALTASFDINGLQSSPDALKTGDVCQDCTKIFELLEDMLSSSDLQKKIMAGIDHVCSLLPGPAASLCKEEVDKMLPLAITFFTGVAKPGEICKLLGLCNSCPKSEKMLTYDLQAIPQSDNSGPQCSFCLFFVKTLEEMVPQQRTEEAVTKLLEKICHVLPPSYRSQCQAIVDKFSKTVMDAFIHYATPETICALLHMCKHEEAPVFDPCTLTLYSCRDTKTALKCGTLFYCQKFAWKSLNYNTL